MSDHVIKIIPSDPYLRIAHERAQDALVYLKQSVKADAVELSLRESPAFVDCGSNLESIHCPFCNELLDFGWWGDEMDRAYQSGFADLSVELPCCGKYGTLNDLTYCFPCGFSCVEFDIIDPTEDLDENVIAAIQSLLEITVRVIHAHI